MAQATHTLFVSDDESQEDVVKQAVEGLKVTYKLLDYSAGGSPTFRFEGDDADLETLRERVGGEE
jgi:hypothetical protein